MFSLNSISLHCASKHDKRLSEDSFIIFLFFFLPSSLTLAYSPILISTFKSKFQEKVRKIGRGMRKKDNEIPVRSAFS